MNAEAVHERDRQARSSPSQIADILKLLPHRYPFLMVDRIIGIRGDDCAIGIKNVTFNEPQFLRALSRPIRYFPAC